MDATDPIVDALKKKCQEAKLAPSDPVADDPVDAVLRLELLQEDTVYIAIVIYDTTKRLMSVQMAKKEGGDEGVIADDAVSLRLHLPKGGGSRLEKALEKFASEIASFLVLSELDDDDDDDDAEFPDEDASDEEEEGGGPYPGSDD